MLTLAGGFMMNERCTAQVAVDEVDTIGSSLDGIHSYIETSVIVNKRWTCWTLMTRILAFEISLKTVYSRFVGHLISSADALWILH